MRNLLLIGMLALVGLSACKLFNRSGQLTAEVIEVDSLTFTPEQLSSRKPIEIAKGVLVTPISRTQAVLTQPAPKAGKVKYKNVGNTDIKDKSVVKDKSKVKAENIAESGSSIVQEKPESKGKHGWLKWLLLAAVVAAALILLFRVVLPRML